MADLTSQIKEDDPRGELTPPLALPAAERVLEGQDNVEDSESPTRTTQKTFLERMQDNLAQPGVAPLAPLGQALYMKDPEIPPFKADLPPEKDVGGFYGTPSEDAAKFSVGDKDVVFYDKTRGAPAIFGEPTQEFEPIFGKEIFGIDIKTEQFFSRGTDTIDYNKLNPIVKIEDVIDTSNPEEFARINNETGFIDDKGNFYEFPSGISFEKRLEIADKNFAVSFYRGKQGEDPIITPIPFAAGIVKITPLPEDFKDRQLRIPLSVGPIALPPTQHQRLLGFNQFTLTVKNYAEPDVIKGEAMKAFNTALIEQSDNFPELKLARNRLGILEYARATDFAMGLAAIPEYGRSGARFPFEFGGWFLAEGVQALSKTINFLTGGVVPAIPEVGPFDSRTRQEIVQLAIPKYADDLQRRLLGNGIDISYGVAEYLARYSLGLPARILGNALEIAMPTGLAARAKSVMSKADYARFKQFRRQKVEEGRTDVDDFNFMEEFLDSQKGGPIRRTVSGLLSTPVTDNRFFSGPNMLRRGFLDSVNTGKNIDEIDGLPLPQRSEFLLASNNKAESVDQINRIKATAKKESRGLTVGEKQAIEMAEKRIASADLDMMELHARGNLPTFMVNAARDNKVFTITAAVSGQMIQAMGGDPGLGEGIGVGAAFVTNFGVQPALRAVRRLSNDTVRIEQALEVAQGINTFDPEYREGILTRLGYLRELQQELVAEGMNPTDARLSVGQLTGLAVLQSLDTLSKQQLSVKELRKLGGSRLVKEAIDIQTTETNLLASMRGIITKMRLENYEEGTAALRTQGLLEEAIKIAEASVTQRKADLQRISDVTQQKIMAMVADSANETLNNTDLLRGDAELYDDLMESMLELDIAISPPDPTVIAQIAEAKTKKVLSVAEAKALKARAALSDVSAGQIKLQETIGEDGKKIFGRDVTLDQDSVPNLFNTGHHIQQGVYEIKHTNDYFVATAGYRALDRQTFVDINKNPVGRDAYVDGGEIFDQLITSIELDSGVELINFATGKNLDAKSVRASLDTLNDRAFEFFESAAEAGDDVTAEIKNVVELASQDQSFADQYKNIRRIKGRKDALIAALYQRHLGLQDGVTVDTMKISYTALSKLSGMFKSLGQTALSRGNQAAVQRYKEVDSRLQKMFSEFVVEDDNGVVREVGDLYVIFDDKTGEIEKVTDAVARFNTQFMNYKATWFDNPVIARKMSWGNRSAIEPNPDYPVGYVPKEGSEPENWFNFAAVKGPDGVKNIQAMFKNHRQAIGEPDKLGQRHINPDSEVGRTSIIGLEIELLNYIKGQTLSPDFNLNILDQELELIQKTFTGINSKGETVELFDFSRIVEDTKGYFSGSVPDQVKLDVEMAENALVAKQKRKFDDAAAAYEADMNKGISVIKQYVSGSVSPSEAVRKLVNAGPQAVNQVRQALMTTKNADGVPFSKDQVDSLLADLAIEFMEGNIFPSTRRFDVNPRNPNQLIPQFDFDMGTMSEILGVNDPNKAIAMKNIIGEKRYNIALKILDFAKNKESSPLGGLSISGIPRSFSMESYISRFYAINRDVIGPQYVATESILQRFRLKNFSIIQAALTDPIVGELFLEMLTSGKLLPPAKEKDLQLRLVAVYSKLSSTLERDDAISMDDVRGLPGWKIRKLTEDPYKGGMFPLYPEFKLEEMVRKIPVSPPMPTTESPFVRRN